MKRKELSVLSSVTDADVRRRNTHCGFNLLVLTSSSFRWPHVVSHLLSSFFSIVPTSCRILRNYYLLRLHLNKQTTNFLFVLLGRAREQPIGARKGFIALQAIPPTTRQSSTMSTLYEIAYQPTNTPHVTPHEILGYQGMPCALSRARFGACLEPSVQGREARWASLEWCRKGPNLPWASLWLGRWHIFRVTTRVAAQRAPGGRGGAPRFGKKKGI